MCKVLVWYDKELANEMLVEVWDVLDRLYGPGSGTELGLRVKGGKSINNFFLKLQVSIHLEEKYYVYNIFTTFS